MDDLLFRNPVQVGMVVSDLDQTLEKFQSLLGIGPFRMAEYPPAGEEGCLREYQGKPADFTARFCFFHFGNIELEVIQPLTGNSIWSDFLREHGPGLHHLKFSMDRLEPARRQLDYLWPYMPPILALSSTAAPMRRSGMSCLPR